MVVLELLLSEQCPLLQVCVCVSTAPGVCVLGWVKCREHISLLVILFIIVYVTNKKITKIIQQNYRLSFFSKPISDNGKMLKYRGENIGKPIYRSISSLKADFFTTLVIDDCIRRVNTRLLEVESDCSCRSGGSMAISF